MISKMNYLLLSTMMIAAIDSTFGRGCDCCKKLCSDKDSSEPSINSENNKTNVEGELITKNEEENKIGTIYSLDADSYKSQVNSSRSDGLGGVSSNDKENEVLNNNKGGNVETNTKEEILYYKIVDKNDHSVQSCFCQNWYEQRKEGVVQLVSVKEKDNGDVLEVIGKGNNWRIVDKNGNSFKYNNCDPSKNTWIIFSITLWDEAQQKPGETLTFYVDDISTFVRNKFNNNITTSVFYDVKCYALELLCANTANVENFSYLFCHFKSILEKDIPQLDESGLKGLEKLNVSNAHFMNNMFLVAIYKQTTINQLAKWVFSKQNDYGIDISYIFSTLNRKLNFNVLDEWADDGDEIFKKQQKKVLADNIFFFDFVSNEKTQNLPKWYKSLLKT